MIKRSTKLWLALILGASLFSFTASADLRVQLAANSDGSLSTKYPAGNKPAGGASCSTWTCAQKGDAAGEIDEESATQLAFSASGSDIFNSEYAYQLAADTGDIQVLGTIPASYSGYVGNFSSAGLVISEGTGDSDYVAKCWCPNTGSVRFTTGTPSSSSTQVGVSESCYSKQLALQYDQIATSLVCLESSNGTDWTSVGSSVSKTLSCASDCPSGAFATSSDSAQTTFVTMAGVSVGTSITVPSAGEPDPPSTENLLLNLDFASGTFDGTQVSTSNPSGGTIFPLVPAYGRPTSSNTGIQAGYTGNGDLLEIVRSSAQGIYNQGPVRGFDDYALKFTVKNTANDSEPADCDVPFPTCDQRRTEISMQVVSPRFYDAFLYQTEYWASISFYLPSTYWSGGSSWGPIVYQIKPQNEGGLSHNFAIEAKGDRWNIRNSWCGTTCSYVWQYEFVYSSSGNITDAIADFPNQSASQAALGDVTRDTWHDFVIHVNFDARAAGSGGVGFLDLWKRTGSGSWVKVLEIRPRQVTQGGVTYDRGVGFHRPPASGNNGGFGPKFGMYMAANQVAAAPNNRVVYIDNVRIANANASCVDVTPDGSDCDP